MRPQQLEALTLDTIERVRAGQPNEDDRVELKSTWPTKARQLAGSANRARGEWLIYIIGIDGATGHVQSPGNIDPADWIAKISSRFDGVSPAVVHHLNVPVGPSESVVALLFRTDRAPYVVKSEAGGTPELEVPIRDATRTRSARRDELLMMLVPAVDVPAATILAVDTTAYWQSAEDGVPERVEWYGNGRIYLGHHASSSILLPAHMANVSILVGGVTVDTKLEFSYSKNDVPSPYGVYTSAAGVMASGPGYFNFYFRAATDVTQQKKIARSPDATVAIILGLAGNDRQVETSITSSALQVARSDLPTHRREIGRWRTVD
jgi:hypothetical protein